MKNYKKSLSLAEILVSVMLISTLVLSMLEMRNNNLNFLEKRKNDLSYDSYMSMLSLKIDNKEGTFYLGDIIDFKNDDIRRNLKKIKILSKTKELKSIKYEVDGFSISIRIIENKLTIDEKFKKTFYTFML